MTTQKLCTLDGCLRAVVGRGLCRMHYLAEWRAGTVTDRPTRERVHTECPATHGHDLKVCWSEHGCRCDRCKHLRKMDRQRRRNRLNAYGRPEQIAAALVPVLPAREHILRLKAQGRYSLEQIADAAGVSRSDTAWIFFGPRGDKRGGRSDDHAARRARKTTVDAILAVTVGQLTSGVTSPVPTMRRLQALVAIGYSETSLSRLMGMRIGNFNRILMGRRPLVLASTDAAARELFAELCMRPVTGKRGEVARRLAKRHRWLPPLAWDDIDFDAEPALADDPAGVDEMAIELACQGEKVRLTPLERREVVTRLNAAKLSDRQIAERAHFEARTVLRIRQELGIAAAVGADGLVVA